MLRERRDEFRRFAEEHPEAAQKREEKADRNQDGKVDAAEKEQAVRVHESLDKDKDGKISPKEREAGRKAARERADRNQEGKVDKAEAERAQKLKAQRSSQPARK